MMNTYLIWGRTAVLTALLVGLASCRQTEPTEGLANPVRLFPEEVATKGAVTTTANIGEFTAFGYKQGRQDWSAVAATATANLMHNNKYTKTGNSWLGNTETRWPDNSFDRYSFFAYSPTATAGNKITLLTTAATKGYQKVRYETLSDVPSQVDLVLASRLNQTPVNEVPLSFVHTLSRVGFIAYTDKPGVIVKSISINGIQYQGDIEVRGDGVWIAQSPKANFTATINSGELSTDVDNPTDLTGGGAHHFMILPQNLTTNVDPATCITVVSNKYGVDKSTSYTIKQDFQKGKSLIYKLYIKNGVELVVDWAVTEWGTTNIPTDITATYLNVSSLGQSGATTTFFYGTDYTGGVQFNKVNSADPITITSNTAQKTFSVTCTATGTYTVEVVAGKLTRRVTVTR